MTHLQHLTSIQWQLSVPRTAACIFISWMYLDKASWILFLILTDKSHVPAFRVSDRKSCRNNATSNLEHLFLWPTSTLWNCFWDCCVLPHPYQAEAIKYIIVLEGRSGLIRGEVLLFVPRKRVWAFILGQTNISASLDVVFLSELFQFSRIMVMKKTWAKAGG